MVQLSFRIRPHSAICLITVPNMFRSSFYLVRNSRAFADFLLSAELMTAIIQVTFLFVLLMAISALAAPGQSLHPSLHKQIERAKRNLLAGLVGNYMANNNAYYNYYGKSLEATHQSLVYIV